MSTTYKILTEGLSLTRFAGGNFECHLNIHKYVSYCESYSLKLNYRQVEHLKESMIDFLREEIQISMSFVQVSKLHVNRLNFNN